MSTDDADVAYDPATHYDRVTRAWGLLLGAELHYGVFDSVDLPLEGGLPATEGEFDMVMSHDVVEHLPDSPRYLFTELMSRVRTGGYLYVTVPSHVNIRKRLAVLRGKTSHPAYELYYWSPIPNRGHFREYTRGDCEGLAKAASNSSRSRGGIVGSAGCRGGCCGRTARSPRCFQIPATRGV